jgi:hypothetical protein
VNVAQPRHPAGDGPPPTRRRVSRKFLVILIVVLVTPFLATTIAVAKLRPTMHLATQAANDFLDEAREGRPFKELTMCAPPRPFADSTTGLRDWTPDEERLRPGPHYAMWESVGHNLSQVWVSGTIGEGVDTATVSGRLDLAESAGGQAMAVSVRLRLVDGRWCVRDVWLEISHREAIRRRS